MNDYYFILQRQSTAAALAAILNALILVGCYPIQTTNTIGTCKSKMSDKFAPHNELYKLHLNKNEKTLVDIERASTREGSTPNPTREAPMTQSVS